MPYFSKIKQLLILALLISVVFFISSALSKRHSSNKTTRQRTTPQDPMMSAAKKFGASYRKCLLKRLFNASKIWEEIQDAIDMCLDKTFWRAVDLHRFEYGSANFTVILPMLFMRSSGVAVRLNIYSKYWLLDLEPEKALRNFLPYCKFYGAGFVDAIDFRPVGKFYKNITFAVEWPTQYWDPTGNGRGGYIANISVCPCFTKAKTLLEKTIKEPRVDYLWIHPGITWQLGDGMVIPKTAYHDHNILVETTNVTICQVIIWSVMFNRKNGIDTMENARAHFKNRFLSVLVKSPFLLLKSEYSEGSKAYLSEFYVNFNDPYCVKKYLATAFCNGGDCRADDQEEEDFYNE